MQASRLLRRDGSVGRSLFEISPAELQNIAMGLTTGGAKPVVNDPDGYIKVAIAAGMLRNW